MLKKRKAHAEWLRGAVRLSHDPDSARIHFDRAASLDPAMADAWLGLHATGIHQRQAVHTMAACEQRFGEERRRHNHALTSTFSIAPYVTCRLDVHAELWCAVAADHLDRDEYDAAEQALRRVDEGFLAGELLRGRIAFARSATEEAIIRFRGLIGAGDHFFEAAARLLSAITLAEFGAMNPARDHLIWILDHPFISNAHPEAHYWMAKFARAEGDEESARHHLHAAFALRPDFPGLREAMDAGPPAPRISVPRAAAEEKSPGNGVTRAGAESSIESVDDVLAELDRQIGQDAVKSQVRSLLAQKRAQIARREAGLPQARTTEHFVFTGPPGTGKTTVARSIARLYKALGILEKGEVVEVDRSALIGEYLGQTVARTSAKLDEAMGGVLFIDEAYALQTDGYSNGDAFGTEAIDTLLKRMEDDRDELVIIAAGYPEPMQRFLRSNPGLSSRFTTTIDFAPYSSVELLDIAQLLATQMGNTLTPDAVTAVETLLQKMDEAGELRSPTFGNARFVRNLVEKAARQRDVRLFSGSDTPTPDVSALGVITRDDVEAAT